MIYAIFVNTMPVVVLNAVLITINVFQLVKAKITKKKTQNAVNSEENCAYNQENTQE